MPKYNKRILAKKAKEMSVPRDTYEKMLRLTDILKGFNSIPFLRDNLSLKGGTAINLLLVDTPRLSVDTDFDISNNIDKESLPKFKKQINQIIQDYMTANGYALSDKTKAHYGLDSFVYSYTNSAGNKDNIKIEINYLTRAHILPLENRPVLSKSFSDECAVSTLSPIEIYASKTKALLTRGAARDLYDVFHMIQAGVINESNLELYRKCVVFYLAIGSDKPINNIQFETIDAINENAVLRMLRPVMRSDEKFSLKDARLCVKKFLDNSLSLTDNEKLFLKEFNNGKYIPELLFEDNDILKEIRNHPMAIWKTSQYKKYYNINNSYMPMELSKTMDDDVVNIYTPDDTINENIDEFNDGDEH